MTSKIRVFEGPLCCNTGVCGTDVDQRLVDFTADVNWACGQGADVRRANLAQDPIAFAENPIARQFVQTVGAQGLPLVLVDDLTVVTGRYPTRDELAKFAGLAGDQPRLLPVTVTSACCGGTPQAVPGTPCC